MKTKQRIRIVIGAICVCVSVVLAVVLVTVGGQEQTDMSAVVVLTRDVNAGEFLREDDLAVVNLPRDFVEGLVGCFDSVEKCLEGDYRAAITMTAGQVLSTAQLRRAQEPMEEFIHKGMRLVSITPGTTAASLSGIIEAGDVVSVAAIDQETGRYYVDERLRFLQVYSLSDAEGITVDSMATLSEQGESEDSGRAQVLTLICKEEQAVLLAELQQMNPYVLFVGRGVMAEVLLEEPGQ